jgi:hypothetical protein
MCFGPQGYYQVSCYKNIQLRLMIACFAETCSDFF